MTKAIEIWIPGIPRPGGSKIPGVTKTGRRFVRPDSKYTKPWMGQVSFHAQQQYAGEILTGVLQVDFIFVMPRPKYHFRVIRGQVSSELKPNQPKYCGKLPDRTKLMRSTEDALTGIVWRDDSQVVEGYTRKLYGDKPGVKIIITELENVFVDAEEEIVCQTK